MLKEEELKNISGGFNLSIAAVIGGIVAFVAGILDGYTRPYKCR